MWRSFPYSRRSLAQNAIYIGAIIPVTLALFIMIEADLPYLLLIILLEAVMFTVMGISPLLTAHELVDGVLVLRQGWYFRARVPLDEIISVKRLNRGPKRTGVFFRLTGSTLHVTTRRDDLIEIELAGKRSFGWALGKRADRIIFDAEDSGALLAALKR